MVYIYTLVNNIQIIGYQSLANEYITIKDPYYIMESQDDYGNNGMRLINVCTFSQEQCIVINDKHIEYMTRYYEKIVNAYNHSAASRLIEDAIKEMDSMEERMKQLISDRLVGGSTIN
jgi:hypothetical protein